MATIKKTSNKESTQPKVLNAFEAFISLRKASESKIDSTTSKAKPPIKKSLRDESIIKICATCGKEYHPTRNGYSQVSKYCSQKCTMEGVRKKLTIK